MDAAPAVVASRQERGRGEGLSGGGRLFTQTRDGFVRQGIGYDAAMVSLDLALLYLKEGRTGGGAVGGGGDGAYLLGSQDVHREAMAALLLFQDASRREVLTAALVREVGSYLEAARVDPLLRFREGLAGGE